MPHTGDICSGVCLMPYFPVDDQAAFHPKIVAAGNAAIGLWVRAGAWSKNHATGGLVPDAIARSMGSRAEIRRLIETGLWDEVLPGYQFHDWDHYGANRTGAEEEARREEVRAAARDRKRRQRDRERDGHAVTGGVTSHDVTAGPSRARSRALDPSPSPSPDLSDIPKSSSVPQTGDEARTDDEVPTELVTRSRRIGVDLERVRRALSRQTGHLIAPEIVLEGIVLVIGRAKPRKGDRTGLVLSSLQSDWAEWQQLIDRIETSA